MGRNINEEWMSRMTERNTAPVPRGHGLTQLSYRRKRYTSSNNGAGFSLRRSIAQMKGV